jgi:hypothetical protein
MPVRNGVRLRAAIRGHRCGTGLVGRRSLPDRSCRGAFVRGLECTTACARTTSPSAHGCPGNAAATREKKTDDRGEGTRSSVVARERPVTSAPRRRRGTPSGPASARRTTVPESTDYGWSVAVTRVSGRARCIRITSRCRSHAGPRLAVEIPLRKPGAARVRGARLGRRRPLPRRDCRRRRRWLRRRP